MLDYLFNWFSELFYNRIIPRLTKIE